MNQCDTVVSSASSEAQRLARLALLQVVDTAAEPFFDALAAAAQAIAGTPIALVSLVDERRQWWKANIGLPGFRKPHASWRSAPTPSRAMR